LDWNNNQYNTIKSIQYYTRSRLIVISQAIGDKRIPKFIGSGWDVFTTLAYKTKDEKQQIADAATVTYNS